MSAVGEETKPNRSTRALVLAALGAASVLAAAAGAIALMGSGQDGEPKATLVLAPAANGPDAVPLPLAGQAARYVNGNLVSDLALLDDTSDGPLPKIGADGRMPKDAYAAHFPADTRARIAIVMTGLGVSDSATAAALARLPPPVTVAFVPFGPKLQTIVDEARGQGREVLLQVPMEPFDFPDSDPGPHALLTASDVQENLKRLHWSLGRATGYVGVANLQGGRFLGETGAIEPVLTALSSRGVMFFDTGAYSNSVAATAARHAGTAFAAGLMTLDAVQSQEAIDAELMELESDARQNGSAVGVASPYPVSIERIAQWAQGLQARGFVLAPLSAVASRPVPEAKQ